MNFPDPLLQLGFATLLEGARDKLLLGALRETVRKLPTRDIDSQLSDYVSEEALRTLAGQGIRGETIFPLPLVLRAAPNLLGYYRLLFGYSQKLFYGRYTGASCLRAMETEGRLTAGADSQIEEACREFARAGDMLVQGLGSKLARSELPHELSLLTLGAQFRGGANNKRGSDGIKTAFAVLERVFGDQVEKSGERSITVKSATGRSVLVEIAADPDILIKSTMADGQSRPVVAIEVKAGEDHSNIWNRVGEAEKSHQRARALGINERWTIVNDPRAPPDKLRGASGSTTRFYQLLELTDDQSAEYQDFRSRIRDMVGL